MDKSTFEELKELHEMAAEHFFELSVKLIANLCVLTHMSSPSDIPPSDKTIEYVSESMDKVQSALEHDMQKLKDELRDFFISGLDKLSKTRVDIKNSFSDMCKYCLYMQKLYTSFDGYENLIESIPVINQMTALARETDKKAAELFAYWSAKSKYLMASKPGVEAKQKEMMKRINQIKADIETKGVRTDEGIEISRKDWEMIFIEKEIYGRPTKLKYKRKIEEMISKSIKIVK